MTDDVLLAVLSEAAAAVRTALDGLDDWGPAGTRPGQYHSDLVADRAAIDILRDAGLGVLSEETGPHDTERDLVVVLDPVDGSTNAARGIPWFATSLCVVDERGARVALVVNQATGERFEAVRGDGATRNGGPLGPTACTRLADAVLGLTGYPPVDLGWRQMRSLGAAALDLCAVACGHLDAYIDCSNHAHSPWDYLGGMLVCQEAGASVAEASGRALVTLGWTDRRVPVAAATPELLAEALSARQGFPVPATVS
ncbi:MAG TPA: inositol monophosphatase [Acidimicrobiales bacterium]|nr:inositol monophosphatase [Acidimicrobiales bacterium]